jgi:hypothetical protein
MAAYFRGSRHDLEETAAMADRFNFIAACRSGMILRTRDGGEATIRRVSAEEGLVYGEVRLFGPCVWRHDGLYRDAPAGAAGPLDLMPPAEGSAPQRKTVRLRDALDPANRPFCCD